MNNKLINNNFELFLNYKLDDSKKNLDEEQKIVELEKLSNFENVIKNKLIGQNHAVNSVSGTVKRSKLGLTSKTKPMGSFIFCGPTGVGKTELAKTLAISLYGSLDFLVRFDMSEYMEPHSISKLIGTPPGYIGYDKGGLLTESINAKPTSILLFDEVEKAHPKVMDIFLQILDEGFVKDSKGRLTSFKNTIIILTSNVGSSDIFHFCKKRRIFTEKDFNILKARLTNRLTARFRPEFINRLDEIIVFKPLSKNSIEIILNKLLTEKINQLEKTLKAKIKISKKAKLFILNEGFNLSFGARHIIRSVQHHFENGLSDFVSKHTNTSGTQIFVDKKEKNNELFFSMIAKTQN